jgi:transcriptional regulator with XRE-family HTH domain
MVPLKPLHGRVMVRVGGHIKRLREERGWSQPRLAVEAGIAVSAVSQIENGRRSPNVSTLDKLAEALGVEVAEFFPKAPRRSSLEPSFDDLNGVLEDLRRTTARHEGFQAVRQALDGFCEVWEKRLAEEDFDKVAIEEAGRTISFFWPAVTAAADAEIVDGMRFGTYEEAAAHSKLFPAIRRFQALCDEVNSAYREKFLNAAASNVYPFPQRKAS